MIHVMNTSYDLRKSDLVNPIVARVCFIKDDVKTNMDTPVPGKMD